MTDRPAAYMPGLVSLQAVGDGDRSPDFTSYHVSEAAAVRWKDVLTARSASRCFLLRRNETAWVVYDHLGVELGASADVTSRHVAESLKAVKVDREELEREAQEFFLNDDLKLLACSEAHAGASAADHSNISVLCRRMILEADSDDLRHIFVVDSRRWDCRVTGVVADLTRTSGRMIDAYLDRAQWLSNGWPLVEKHHADVLADRLSHTRSGYVLEVLTTCAAHAGIERDLTLGLTTAWMMAGPGNRYRCAQRIVNILRDGILYLPAAAETFSPDILIKKGAEVIRAAREALLP